MALEDIFAAMGDSGSDFADSFDFSAWEPSFLDAGGYQSSLFSPGQGFNFTSDSGDITSALMRTAMGNPMDTSVPYTLGVSGIDDRAMAQNLFNPSQGFDWTGSWDPTSGAVASVPRMTNAFGGAISSPGLDKAAAALRALANDPRSIAAGGGPPVPKSLLDKIAEAIQKVGSALQTPTAPRGGGAGGGSSVSFSPAQVHNFNAPGLSTPFEGPIASSARGAQGFSQFVDMLGRMPQTLYGDRGMRLGS